MVKTIKGKELDIGALMQANSDSVAVGNANMNARGDLLGRGGKVIKTKEELAREYNKTGSNLVKNVPLSDEINKMMETPKHTAPKPNKPAYVAPQQKVEEKKVDDKKTK